MGCTRVFIHHAAGCDEAVIIRATGAVYKPGVVMAHALASMIDANGKILVDGAAPR